MLKLNYFNGRGMAETSRLILNIADVDYEDFRYPIQIIEWKTHNMVRVEFDKDKSSGKLWRSMGKVPFLEIGDGVISQSKAIERYLARKFNLMGDTEEEAALIDSYCEYIRDFKTAYQSSKRSENKEAALKTWFNDTLPKKLWSFDKMITKNTDFQLQKNENIFSVGNRLSLADIIIYSFLVDFFDNKDGVLKAYNNCSTLKKIVKNVSNNPKIENWVNNRSKTAF